MQRVLTRARFLHQLKVCYSKSFHCIWIQLASEVWSSDNNIERGIMLKVVLDSTVESFLNNAGPMLYQNEATNGLMLGLCEAILVEAPAVPPVLIRVVENGKTVSAALQTHKNNLIVTYANPEILKELANFLKTNAVDFPGVVGPAWESEYFALYWSTLTNKNYKLAMGQKIYKIEKVDFLQNTNGEFRLATRKDLNLVHDWVWGFVIECLPEIERKDKEFWLSSVEKSINRQRTYLWVKDNAPVSMAQAIRPTKNGISVAGVFTPHDQRGNGYASAVVAHLSQKMLDNGKKFCMLYTDLNNPTSNKIYQKIGYKEVVDSKYFLFD